MLEFNAENHEYRFDGRVVPSVSNILAPYMDFSKIPRQMLADKQAWGTSVHKYLEEYDRGNLDFEAVAVVADGESPDMKAVIVSWSEFITPKLENADTMKIEHKMFSPKLRYAGTADRIVGNSVIEIKTSKPRKAVGVQLAAYASLAKENGLISNLDSVELVSWHVSEHGVAEVRYWDFKTNWNVFLCLLTSFNFFNKE